jgi:hypothetical protein
MARTAFTAATAVASFFGVILAGLAAAPAPLAAGGEPEPGIGLLVRPGEMAALRAKLKMAPWSEMYARIALAADAALKDWPKQRDRIAPHLGKLWDLSVDNNPDWPKDLEVRKAGLALREFALHAMTPAAFVYLIGGEKKYAEAAWEIFHEMGQVNRWGWFPWEGANLPQIEAGMFARNAAFTLDFLWDALTPAQRQRARDILAEKCAEPYFRLVLHTPAMGLHHLRSKNQGNNVLSGALIACLALGDHYPNADLWLRSYVQTFHWILTHDVGWAGQHLESGMPGYWSISMQNLYTAAACLANAKNIDLRGHPAFMEATYYPTYHESTVPPVGAFQLPLDRAMGGPPGVIAGKPIELPHEATCGPWWYDYAARFPQSGAMHFINQLMVRKGPKGELMFCNNDCHQTGHSEILTLLWTTPALHRPNAPRPTELFKTTDRMTMIRSGYGLGQTYLYFNGDLFLSALDEVLLTTAGLSWHYTWHGWQAAESGIQTENEPLAPSMLVKRSAHDRDFSYIHTVSGESNITYYRPQSQDTCYRRYSRRDRDILYVRGEPGSGYFIVVDRVAQQEPRWHATLWQTWNSVNENRTGNYGHYKVESPRRVRLERPNADLALEFVSPHKLSFEVEAAPGQPIVSYMYDHNLATLRALAGGCGPPAGGTITVEPAAWSGAGKVVRGAELGQDAPAAAYRLSGKNSMVAPNGDSRNSFEIAASPLAGQRYRMAIACRKTDCNTYENLCWQIDLELLDGSGKAVALDADPQDPKRPRGYNLPGQYRLSDPRSMTKTTPWLQSDPVYFDVPADARVAKIRGTLRAALWSHPPHGITEKSLLELGTLVIEPVGSPQRRKQETFVALAFPLAKGAASPAVASQSRDGAAYAMVPRGNGVADHVVVSDGGAVALDGGSIAAGLAVVRRSGGKSQKVFALDARQIVLDRKELLRSPAPVDVAARLDDAGKIASLRLAAAGPVKLALQGRNVELPAGAFVAGADLRCNPDPAAAVLACNSPESQRLLQAGLQPLLAKSTAERDDLIRRGMANLARGAKVTASAMRDPRFPPQLVIDNKTWEYPTDGLLDYTQGELLTTPGGGYGRGALPLGGSEGAPLTSWPFYIRPTYWLLPCQQTGWIQLELPRPAAVKIVRLLNTSNAGANDFATMKYHVELLDNKGRVVASRQGEFGRPFDRPFQAAFKIPAAFARYGDTFRGMLEPGVKVPFGDGWQTLQFPRGPAARFVKVYIDSYWALGGGLNEIQVY